MMLIKKDDSDEIIQFPAEFWQVFNARFAVQPITEEKENVYKTLFHRYQLINQSDGTKYGQPMDLIEMVEFMNKSYEEYQKELEKIILG